ncbi:uncharacterized protein LOC100373124 [Saccoglossus kowalevskii]|uniref:Uncharacterized protein LOC100373124 n=1 Tax=Saccoglossus kowalevskii TaxID=10224 RepID=A0ABM0GTK3_SACKO|nr:PREDICTED: uncharacterized protein LOC100373124 [Saccoglossus kowalevskii]
MMNTFVAHPSIRVKGSENNWNPVQCVNVECYHNTKGSHMHCPFCVKTESYHDPVILRAHYRVKHVDKSLEFAGLKILRCCEQCDIVGAIKGEKKFKGAHWHCYRCRNGFNRRDEALKHYKTHFRNPHTTFQIQVAHDINSNASWENAMGGDAVLTNTTTQGMTDEVTIHPVLTEAVMTTTTTPCTDEDMNKAHDATAATISANGLTVAATETVNSDEGSSAAQAVILIESTDSGELDQPATTTIYQTVNDDTHRVLQLEKQIAQLQADKLESEKQLKTEIQKLRDQVQHLNNTNSILQQQIQALRSASLQRLTMDAQADIQHMISNMEHEHSNLLHHHLAQLRQYYHSMSSSESDNYVHPVMISDQTIQQIVVSTQSGSSTDVDSDSVNTTVGDLCQDATTVVIPQGNGNYIVHQEKNDKSQSKDINVEIADKHYVQDKDNSTNESDTDVVHIAKRRKEF